MSPDHKAILRLGIPIAIGQIGVIIMGFADTMMVGRYSTDALAAASFVNSVFNLITFLLMGYSYGLTPLVSALYGRGRRREAGALLRDGVTANLLFVLLLMGIMAAAYFFLPAFGQPAELLPLIRTYYLPILFSLFFVALFNALRQFTDGITDTSVGMWALLCGNALNILGNYLLIYGPGIFPEMGLAGAGLSTLLSRAVMPFILIVVILRRGNYRVYRLGFFARRRKGGVKYVHLQSLPIGLQMGMESGSFTVSGIMAGWLGAIDLATFQVMVTIGTLGFLLYYSFGAGLSIRLAAAYGLRDWQRVRSAARAGTRILLAMAVISSLTFLFLGKTLASLFTTDAAVLSLAVSLIPPLMLYQLGDAMQVCFSNALRATRHVQSVMWIAFVSYVVVNIPVGYFLAFPCGMRSAGLFYAFSAGLFTAGILFFLHFRRALRRDEGESRVTASCDIGSA
ncbi:MAG: MATE family efflux transporter [Alloprevotella sp.]